MNTLLRVGAGGFLGAGAAALAYAKEREEYGRELAELRTKCAEANDRAWKMRQSELARKSRRENEMQARKSRQAYADEHPRQLYRAR